ncbi:uncharacterized protein LOC126835094 [Adelges cooleyi]|uniref:uncharacterized protein LOC126835094 n=1 Tax=Adelges cooleyi TaxID=133065 RepID=UPI00217F668C|nr:uncharacterized protein LOC126835094 [Adelges cooleyi]
MYRLIFMFLAVTSVRSIRTASKAGTQSDYTILNTTSITSLDAENQKVTFTIQYNYDDSYLEVKDSMLDYGKWTDSGCNEITDPNGSKISKDNPLTIRACGRANSPTGVDGYIFLRKQGETKNDYKVKFIVPWIGSDTFLVESVKDDQVVSCVIPKRGVRSIQSSVRCKQVI